jgi:hypothetical protein
MSFFNVKVTLSQTVELTEAWRRVKPFHEVY